jgi:hypothetical protein
MHINSRLLSKNNYYEPTDEELLALEDEYRRLQGQE